MIVANTNSTKHSSVTLLERVIGEPYPQLDLGSIDQYGSGT